MPTPVTSRIDAIIGAVARAMVYAATVAGILLAAFVALSSFMRYLVGSPFAFTEEFVGLLFSAMVFLALPYCAYSGNHIRVTLLTDSLPPRWQRYPVFASAAFTILFCAVFGWFSAEFAWTSYLLNSKSDIGRIPLWPWMAAMPVACLVMAIVAVWRLLHRPPDTGGGTSA